MAMLCTLWSKWYDQMTRVEIVEFLGTFGRQNDQSMKHLGPDSAPIISQSSILHLEWRLDACGYEFTSRVSAPNIVVSCAGVEVDMLLSCACAHNNQFFPIKELEK